MSTIHDVDAELATLMNSLDPNRDELWRDPHPLLHRLRAYEPVHRAPNGTWVVSGHAESDELLREDSWLREEPRPADSYSLAERVFNRSIAFRDPPAHTRLRRAAAPMFTPRALAELRQRVVGMTRELISGYRDRPTFDFKELA